MRITLVDLRNAVVDNEANNCGEDSKEDEEEPVRRVEDIEAIEHLAQARALLRCRFSFNRCGEVAQFFVFFSSRRATRVWVLL